MKYIKIVFIFFILLLSPLVLNAQQTSSKTLYYLTPDIKIPFWQIIAKAIQEEGHTLGYNVKILHANNKAKNELQNTVQAIQEKADAIIVSPTNSSACVTILKLAKQAKIPVVIADIGTLSGDYISYISSNNFEGAYQVGTILSQHLIKKGWSNGRVGIIAIPQKRINGKQRTAGFMQALNEFNIKGADLKQLEAWTDEETYRFTNELLLTYPDLRAIWLQTSNNYKGVLQALKEQNKQDDILFVAFDAEPEFLNIIPQGAILATGMQQPYLIGIKAVEAFHKYFNNQKVTQKIVLPILNITTDNIKTLLPAIQLNVLGITKEE